MRIALDYTSPVGTRAGRLLLGERDLEFLGVVRRDVKDRNGRIRRIDEIRDVDVVVTDDPDSAILDEALDARVPCVLWADSVDRPGEGALGSILAGANLVTGIGRSLAARETDIAGLHADVLFAWTEPGTPLRRGEAVTFPDPVGARWASRRHMTSRRLDVAAPVPDEWAGVVVRTSTSTTTRTLGIADLALHLEAIALASGAVMTATDASHRGIRRPEDSADEYILTALRIGLDIASFTSTA